MKLTFRDYSTIKLILTTFGISPFNVVVTSEGLVIFYSNGLAVDDIRAAQDAVRIYLTDMAEAK